jgi:large repetitive protein
MKNNIAPKSDKIRKSLVCLLSSTGTILFSTMPGTAWAQTAVNTARVATPAYASDPDLSDNEAIDTDTIANVVVVASNDTASGINGLVGATAVVNAFTADTVNGVAASATNATLSVAPGAVPAGLTFDTATGNVDVAAGTPAGSYSFTYTICETLNPTNCATATITVDVVAAAIAADADSIAGVNGASGAAAVLNVLDGDTLNGVPVTLASVDISVTTPATPVGGGPVPVLNVATGLVDVPAGTPAGTYTITYQICEELNPSNCSSNTATVTVAASPLTASNDTASGINGLVGATAVVNAFTADTVNGVAASATNATLSVAPGAVPAGLTFDTATGNVDVAAGTPAGSYSFTYTICETLNPTNCATATITVDVVAAAIATTNDVAPAVNSAIGGTNIINAFANDTFNGAPIDPAQIVASVTSPATPISGGLVPLLNPATGQVDVPVGTPAGTYTINYQICDRINPTNCAAATITVVVEPARGNIAGTVYSDRNANGILDGSEPRRSNWIVEMIRDGVVIGTTRTDAQGNYAFNSLLSGAGYEIRFRNPENNVLYGTIRNIAVGRNTTVIDQNQPIDPSGVIYDSVTRAPVSGATASILDNAGNLLPAVCLVDASQYNQRVGASGDYRFDIVPGAAAQCPVGQSTYRISIAPPTGYSFVSTVLLPQAGALDPTGRGNPYLVSSSFTAPTDASPVYYLNFTLASGDPNVINNHIPLDPFLTRTPLIVTKTSTKRTANTGDVVPYEIIVRNSEAVQRAGVTVVDILPPGMKYVLGTARVNGTPQEPVATERQVAWSGQIIPANGSVRYNLTLIVGAGVTDGERVNTGLAQNGLDNSPISNRGTAVVSIVPSAVFDCSELLGKVFEDRNRNGYQDEGEQGLPGARLATVNGQLVTTDAQGRYHIACAAVPDARIGSNFVLKLDPRTLPLGWEVTTDNPRSIRLTRGKFGELNFGVAPKAAPASPANRKEGEE